VHERSDQGADAAPAWNETKHTVSPRLVTFLLIALIAVVFILQNREPTTIHFLFFDVTTRVWFAIVIALVLGVLLDRLFIAWWRRRRTRE
jgi:uncharacterized integral membrane protein